MTRNFLLSISALLFFVVLATDCDSGNVASKASSSAPSILTRTVTTHNNDPSAMTIRSAAPPTSTGLSSRTFETATPLPTTSATALAVPITASIGYISGLAFSDRMHGWVLGIPTDGKGSRYGEDAVMRTSTNGGETWHPVPAPFTKVAVYTDERQIYKIKNLRFANTRDGWAFDPALFLTHDGGLTWRYEQMAGSIKALEPKDGTVWVIENICKTAFGSRTCKLRLVTSDDMGQTWQDAPNQPETVGEQTQLVRVSKQEAYLYSEGEVTKPHTWSCGLTNDYDSLLLRTKDGGRTWEKLSQPTPFSCSSAYLSIPTANNLWILCAGQPGAGHQEKSVSVSKDGGIHWHVTAQTPWEATTCRSSGAGDITWDGYVRTFVAPSTSRAFLSIDQAGLFTTNDGGRTWNLPYNARDGRAGTAPGPIVFIDAKHGWVADNNLISRTTDGGVTWSSAKAP